MLPVLDLQTVKNPRRSIFQMLLEPEYIKSVLVDTGHPSRWQTLMVTSISFVSLSGHACIFIICISAVLIHIIDLRCWS